MWTSDPAEQVRVNGITSDEIWVLNNGLLKVLIPAGVHGFITRAVLFHDSRLFLPQWDGWALVWRRPTSKHQSVAAAGSSPSATVARSAF